MLWTLNFLPAQCINIYPTYDVKMSESKTIPNKLPYAMVESSCVSFSDKKLVKAKTTPYFVFLGIIQKRKNCIFQSFMMFEQERN